MIARIGIAVVVAASSCLAARGDEPGFSPLVNGDDPAQFALVGIGPGSIKIVDGEVRLTGQPAGYFATKSSYKNYILKFEWMYPRPEGLASDAKFDGNSGLLIHVQEPHKVWPRSIEAQLFNADAGHLFGIVGAKFQGHKDAEAQKRAIKPVGEWNVEEVTCQDGAITCKINGIVVDRGTGAEPDHGAIGLQSEGKPIRFRNMAIKVLGK